MPALNRYIRRVQVVEAQSQLSVLRSLIDASGTLPTTLPPTPPIATPGERSWPADAHPGWAALGFAPLEPLRYSYSVTTDPMLGTVRIEATGDLDADGFRSSYSQLGHITPGPAGTVSIAWDEVIPLDELE